MALGLAAPHNHPQEVMELPEYNRNGLLPLGVHAADMRALHERCVVPFGMSNREALWQGLQRYQAALLEMGIHTTQWVNGSFVDSTRHTPEDIDLVNFCMEKTLQQVKDADRDRAVELLAGGMDTKACYGCQCELVVVYPRHDPRTRERTKPRMAYWQEWFSTSRDYSLDGKPSAPQRGAKGFVQLFVGDPKLCPDVRQLF